MAFKGKVQRWLKMNAGHVIARSGLWVGGNAAANKVDKFLVGSASETSADLTVTSGNQEKVEVTVTGAALGDLVIASINKDASDLIVTGYVSAANTVQVLVANETAGSVTISQPYEVNVLVIQA